MPANTTASATTTRRACGDEHWTRDESSVQSEPSCEEGTYWNNYRCVLNACQFFTYRKFHPKSCGDGHIHWPRDESSVQSESSCEKGTYWSLESHRCVLDACKYFSFRHNNPKASGDEHWTRDESSVQSENYLKPTCPTGEFRYNGRCIPDACSFSDYQISHEDVCGSDWPKSEFSMEKRSENLIRHCGFTETWNGHKCVPSECSYDEQYRHEHKSACGNW